MLFIMSPIYGTFISVICALEYDGFLSMFLPCALERKVHSLLPKCHVGYISKKSTLVLMSFKSFYPYFFSV